MAPNHLFSIRGASGGTTRGSDSIGNGNDNGALASSFLLQWSTGVSSFTLRSRRCIESIMYHHPNATVRVFSNQLPLSFFSEFRSLGYSVSVVRFNLFELLNGTPAAPWLEQLTDWQDGPYFYSHVTDVVRLALLYKEGGVYLDTDVIVTGPFLLRRGCQGSVSSRGHIDVERQLMGPFDSVVHRRTLAERLLSAVGTAVGGAEMVATNTVPNDTRSSSGILPQRHTGRLRHFSSFRSDNSRQSHPSPHSFDAQRQLRPLQDAIGIEELAAGDPSRPVFNGAVLVFAEPGSRFLWSCMHEFRTSYIRDRWGWNGPELLTRVRRKCANAASVQAEPPERFYPLHWREVASYAVAGAAPRQARMWQRIAHFSSAAHLWNRKTSGLALEQGSVLDRLLREYTVLPSGTRHL